MNFSELRLRNGSSWTIFVFGLLATVLGGAGLLNPDFLLWQLGFETVDRAARAAADFTTVFIATSSMASFNIGIYYMLAALTNWKPFYFWTVPFRILTFLIFTALIVLGYAPLKFFTVPLWELVGALCTGFALWREKE